MVVAIVTSLYEQYHHNYATKWMNKYVLINEHQYIDNTYIVLTIWFMKESCYFYIVKQ